MSFSIALANGITTNPHPLAPQPREAEDFPYRKHVVSSLSKLVAIFKTECFNQI